MDRVSATLGLQYLGGEEFESYCRAHKGHLLGAIAFGARCEHEAPDCPYAHVELRTLEQPSAFEIWTSGQPVVRDDPFGIATARNDELLFGCLQVGADAHLNQAVYGAYCRIFDVAERLGYYHLLRVWHYLPRINGDADGLERYRWFNVGRHEAFRSHGRVIEECAPAACALGTGGGPLTIYFLAARKPGQPVSNPRQWAPYRYPPSYGPRGPAFSRGMRATVGGVPVLFISGTASIVGHETMHAGDAVAQAHETAENLRAVLEQVSAESLDYTGPGARKFFRVYLRDPGNLGAIREHLARSLAPRSTVIYLQADICRSDLLLEVEGACIAGGGA